jgi:hydroxymethylglutaryl-CoA synthase
MTSYGSGAGSDGFDMTVTDNIKRLARQKAPTVAELVADKEYVDYGVYSKMTNLLFLE